MEGADSIQVKSAMTPLSSLTASRYVAMRLEELCRKKFLLLFQTHAFCCQYFVGNRIMEVTNSNPILPDEDGTGHM